VRGEKRSNTTDVDRSNDAQNVSVRLHSANGKRGSKKEIGRRGRRGGDKDALGVSTEQDKKNKLTLKGGVGRKDSLLQGSIRPSLRRTTRGKGRGISRGSLPLSKKEKLKKKKGGGQEAQ